MGILVKKETAKTTVLGILNPPTRKQQQKTFMIKQPLEEKKNLYGKDGSIKGATTKMSDGTIITWRKVSSSDGSPAIDINIKYSNDSGGLKRQKIHFVKERLNNENH